MRAAAAELGRAPSMRIANARASRVRVRSTCTRGFAGDAPFVACVVSRTAQKDLDLCKGVVIEMLGIDKIAKELFQSRERDLPALERQRAAKRAP